MKNTHTWILSRLLKMSLFFPPAETLKLEILKTFLLMRYLVKTIVMWQEMILRVMDISQRLWNILSLLKMLFIILFIFLVLYSASCDWLLLWAIRTQAVHMLLKVEVRIILKVRTVLPDLYIYIYISCTNFVSPFTIFMFWWNTYADSSGGSDLSVQNNGIHLDLVQKTKKLNRLQEKVTVLLRYSYFDHFYNCWIICICFMLYLLDIFVTVRTFLIFVNV